MKPSNFALSLCITIILLQSSCNKLVEPENSSAKPIIAIYPQAAMMNFPDSLRNFWDLTKNPMVISSILLPNNCSVTFAICNIGPQGSVLDFSVNDSQGVLVCSPSAGSVIAGSATTVIVNMYPHLIDGNTWTQIVLEVNTPKASNFTKSIVAIKIENLDDYESHKLCDSVCGTWSGNWYGTSSATYAGPSTNVSGSWTLDLDGFDIIGSSGNGPVNDSKVYGKLHWSGTDAYWSGPSYTLHQYPVNETIILNSSNTKLYIMDAGCNLTWSGEFYIVICPGCQSSDPCNGYNIDFSLSVSKYKINWSNSHWSTCFENQQDNCRSFSSGLLSGQK